MRVLNYPDPVLLQVGKPYGKDEFDEHLARLAEDMFETMLHLGGVGLAGPQVGVSRRLFVMDCSGGEDESQRVVMINPEIIAVEGEQLGDEGCLSFPGIYAKIKRDLRAVVRYRDISGTMTETTVEGLPARCVLHETDHCDGIVFLDRMTMLKRELARRKIKKLKRTGEWEQADAY